MMADADIPPPAYPGIVASTVPITLPYDKDYIIMKFKFTGSLFGSPYVKIFGEEKILDALAPVLNEVFPEGELTFSQEDHMMQFSLHASGLEYTQIQIFKIISSQGFILRASHPSVMLGGGGDPKVKTATYTFARS